MLLESTLHSSLEMIYDTSYNMKSECLAEKVREYSIHVIAQRCLHSLDNYENRIIGLQIKVQRKPLFLLPSLVDPAQGSMTSMVYALSVPNCRQPEAA